MADLTMAKSIESLDIHAITTSVSEQNITFKVSEDSMDGEKIMQSTTTNMYGPSSAHAKIIPSSSSSSIEEYQREKNNLIHTKLDSQSREYERAIRRALLENEYVRKVNSQLITKLTTMTHENEASQDSITKMKSVCDSMKEFITELASAKDDSDGKVAELERTYKQVADAEEARKVKLEALKVGQHQLDGMVNAMRDSLEVARRQRDEAREEVKTLVAAKEALAEVAAEKSTDVAKKEQEIVSLSDEKIDLEGRLDVIAKERDTSAKELDEVTSERDELKVKCGKMQVQMNEKEELVESVATISKTSGDWEARYTKSTQELKQITSERDGLKVKCGKMQTEKEELEETVDMLAKDSDDWQAKCVKSTKKLDEVTSERDALKSTANELSNFKACSLGEKVELKQSNSKLVAEREELCNKVKLLEDRGVKSEKRSKDFLEVLDSVKVSLADTKAKNDELLAANDSMEQEIKLLQCSVDEITTARVTEVGSLQKELETREAKSNELLAENESMQKEIVDLTNQRDELSASKDCMQQELKSLEFGLKEVTAAKATEFKDSRAKIGELSAENEYTQQEIEDITKNRDEILAVKDSMEQEIKTLQCSVDDITTAKVVEVGSLHKELETSKARSNELLAEKEAMQKEIVDITKKMDELSASMKLQIGSLLSEVFDITTARATETKNQQQEIESLQKSLSDAKTKENELSTAQESKQGKIESLQVQVNEIAATKEAEVGNLQISLNDAITARDELAAGTNIMQLEINTLKNTLAQVTASKEAQISNLQKDLEKMQTSLNVISAKDELWTEKNTMQEEINTLQSNMAEMKANKEAELENLRKELETVQSLMDDASTKIDELSAENSSLQKQIQTLQGEISQLTDKNEAETGNLQHELGFVRRQLDDAEWNSKRITIDMKTSQSRLDIAESSVQALRTESNSQLEERRKIKEDLTLELDEMTKLKETMSEKLNSKILSLEVDLGRSKEAEERLVSEMKSLENSHAEALGRVEVERKDLMSQKQDMAERCESLSAELENANEKSCSLSTELNCAKEAAALEHGRLNAKIVSLVADLLEASQVEEKLDSDVKSLEGSHAEALTRFESESKKLTSQKEEAEQRLEGLSAELENANDKVCSLSTELNEAKKAATQEQEQLGSKIKSLESELQKSKEEEGRLGGAMKSLESSHAEALARVDGEKNAFIQVLEQKMNDIVEKSLGAMEEQLKKTTSEKDTLDKELTCSKDQCSVLTKQLEENKLSHDKERGALSLELCAKETNEAELEADRGKLSSSIALLAKELDGLATELNEAKQKGVASGALIEDLQSQQDISSKKVSELTKRVDSANTENGSLSKAKDELSAENSSLQEKMQTLQTNGSQITAAKEAEIGNLQHELESVRKQLVDADENMKRLAIDLETHQGRLETANASIIALHTEKENTLDNFDSKISSLEADLLQSKKEGEIGHSARQSLESSHLETLAKTEGEINDLLHHKQEMAQRIESLRNDIEGSNEKYTARSTELNNAKEAAGQEHERLNIKIATLEAVLLQSKQSTANKMAEAETLQKDLEAVLSQVTSAKDEEIENLQHELRSVRKQREDAEAHAKRLTDDSKAIQHRLQMAEKSIDTLQTQLSERAKIANDNMNSLMKELAMITHDDKSPSNKVRAARAVTLSEKENESKPTRSMQMIGQMKSTLRSLQTQKADLLKTNKEKTAAIDALEDQKQELSQLFDSLSTEIDQANDKSSSLSTELNDTKEAASEDRERLSSKIASLEANLLESTHHVERLGDVMESLQSSQAEALALWEDEKNEIQDRFDSLSETTAVEKKELVERVQALETIKQVQDEKGKQRCEQIKHLIQQVDETEEELDKGEAEIKSLSGKLQEQSDKIVQLNKQIEDATSNIADLEKSLEDRKTHNETLTKKLLEGESEIVAVTAVSEGRRDQIVQLEKQIEDATSSIADLEISLEDTKAQNETLTNKLSEVEIDRDAAMTANMEQCDEIVQLKKQIEDATSNIADLEKSLGDMNTQNEILTKKLLEVEIEKEATTTVNKGLSDELKSTASTLSDVQMLISVDQKQATEMKNKIRCLETEKKVLEESILSVKKDRDDVESKLEFSSDEAEDFRCKLESSESLAERMTNQCEQLTRDVDTSRQEADGLRVKFESSETFARALANKCDQLANDRDNLEAKLEASMHKAESSKSLSKSMATECDKLTSYIAELSTKHGAAEASLNDLRLENQRNIAKWETKQAEISCLENIISSLKKEYEAFKVESKATTAKQLRSCKAKLEPLCVADGENGTLRGQEQTFDDMIVILQKERAILLEYAKLTPKKLKASEDERSCLESIVTSLKDEYEDFKVEAASTFKKLKAAQDERSYLENIVTSLKKEYEAFRAEAAAQMRSCEAKLETLLGSTGGGYGVLQQQDRSFDDMVAIIQNEQSNLSLMAKELEAAQDESVILEHQVRILSTEVSKYKLQNKGMLQALDELTVNSKRRQGHHGDIVPMDEVAVDRSRISLDPGSLS